MQLRLLGQEVTIDVKATRGRTISAATTIVTGQLKSFESHHQHDPDHSPHHLLSQAFDQAAVRVADLRGLKQLVLRATGIVCHRGSLPVTVEVSTGLAQATLSNQALAIARPAQPHRTGLVAVVASEATTAYRLATELQALEGATATRHATAEHLQCIISDANGATWTSPRWQNQPEP